MRSSKTHRDDSSARQASDSTTARPTSGAGLVKTSIRWSQDQIDVVTRAAKLAGVPYQSYLKTVTFRAALADLQAAHAAGIT